MKIMKKFLISISLFSLLSIASVYAARSGEMRGSEGRSYSHPGEKNPVERNYDQRYHDQRYHEKNYEGYGHYGSYGESGSGGNVVYPTSGYPAGPVNPGENEANTLFRENQSPQ